VALQLHFTLEQASSQPQDLRLAQPWM